MRKGIDWLLLFNGTTTVYKQVLSNHNYSKAFCFLNKQRNVFRRVRDDVMHIVLLAKGNKSHVEGQTSH